MRNKKTKKNQQSNVETNYQYIINAADKLLAEAISHRCIHRGLLNDLDNKNEEDSLF